MTRHTDYDAIVIGSGAGGLTAAVCMARAGQRVLVLEQHYLPGGWCHSFSLEGFLFSPGVHYIGGLGEGGGMRQLYEGLGVADDLVFLELNPDGYDHVVAGQERFDIPAGRDRFQRRLEDRFPQQKKAIGSYLDAVARVGRELEAGVRARDLKEALMLPRRIPTVLSLGFRSLDHVLDRCGVKDPMLRTILSVQAGDHGVAPDRAPFVMQAAITDHYMGGGWYPKGGAKSLPKAFIKQLRAHGGEIRVRTAVDRILIEGEGNGRRAVGVRLADGTTISAKHIISNADPAVTFSSLVGDEHLSRKLRLRLKATRYSISALSLFAAVDMDLEAAGLDSGNVWFNRTADVQAGYDAGEQRVPWAGELPGFFLTATTLKDRSKRKDGLHTLEAFSFTRFAPFQRWASSTYGDRPADYERLKKDIAAKMFDTLELLVPGITERVVFSTLGTPLTNQHYVAATEGNLYGIEKSRHQVGPLSFGVKTEIPGLFMCGASTIAHGVAGATMSGVAAACTALRARRREVLTGTGTLKTAPCEPSTLVADDDAVPSSAADRQVVHAA
jgi:all-trans-retinol 13,14-reductase